jgi:tripartite-type tricarboxylate transporter receptor subunit TctC
MSFAVALAAPAQGQGYPEKPIRFVVPYAPGGSTDFLARLVGQKFTEAWKHQVIVENRPGGGGNVGADAVARSPADGYTIVLISFSHAVGQSLFKKLPFDLTTDLQAVGLIARQPNALVVHPSLPARSVKDLIALARAKPGHLAFSSGGIGSGQHLMGELFKSLAKVDLIHVGYKGTAPAMVDLISGQVPVSVQPLINAVPAAQSGRIRLLAVTGDKRSPVAPEVPTMAEAGVPGYSVVAWYGVHAPARTPRAVVDTLNREMVRGLGTQEITERLLSQGLEPARDSPDEFAAFVKLEVARWRDVVRSAGIQPE